MKNKLFQSIIDNAPRETDIFIEKYTALVLRLNQVIREKGISQKILADRLDKKPSEISRWLNGGQNLTLRTIAKLEAELEETLIQIPSGDVSTQYKNDWDVSIKPLVVERRKVQKRGSNIDTRELEWKVAL